MLIQLADVKLKPVNVTEALESLTTVANRLWEKGDHRAVFPEVYAIITRDVGRAIEDPHDTTFLEPAWLSRLAGRFCENYLETLMQSLNHAPIRSTAWARAYRYAGMGVTVPLQDALLGINAHINYDLARGLRDNIVSFQAERDARLLERYHHDHDVVNNILEAAIPEIIQTLVNRYHCRLTHAMTAGGRRIDLGVSLVIRILKQWRAQVWNDVLGLLYAPTPLATGEILRRMDRHSGRMAMLLCSGNFAWVQGRPMLPESWVKAVGKLTGSWMDEPEEKDNLLV